jgi:GNAT superfamily N-acetyltransferase
MTRRTETDLYDRQLATMLASWKAIAAGSAGAAVRYLDGAVAAVFPAAPERDIYNNALLARGLGAEERVAALSALESTYASAGIQRFAAWVDESDVEMLGELDRRGYGFSESTLAMGMTLADVQLPTPKLPGYQLAPGDWPEYLRYLHGFGLPGELLTGVDPTAFRVVAARRDDETVATGLAFDHSGDCGIFNVSTLEPARGRGVGTAVTANLLRDARDRGCATASLQSTPIAEGVYSALGFRALGRFLEYTPPPSMIRTSYSPQAVATSVREPPSSRCSQR